MKTAGIDIGTTTISGVVLEKEENGQAKILEAKTVRTVALSKPEMNGKEYSMQKKL